METDIPQEPAKHNEGSGGGSLPGLRQRPNDGGVGMEEKEYMRRAIALAQQAGGFAAPNPLVGAVIVKDGRIIGEGFHRRCGEYHAERNALASLTESAEGATMYVTLEPCCHVGRTPPCTEAIIEHKIAKVYIGSRDPNPLVAGKGAQCLREHGIDVREDFLREECDALNPIFFHYITTKTPYAALKYAMTLDGKIASYTGASQWITGTEARQHVQTLRGRYSAVMAGIGTVLADDPMLNCRLEGAHQPLRVVVDSRLRIPLDSRLCQTAKDCPLLVACVEADDGKRQALEALGVTVCVCPMKDGHVDLRYLMQLLAQRQISSVLIEGGGQLNEAALTADVVQHLYVYIAPKLLGGKNAKTPVEGQGADHPDHAALLQYRSMTRLGDDWLLEYDVERGVCDVHGHCGRDR